MGSWCRCCAAFAALGWIVVSGSAHAHDVVDPASATVVLSSDARDAVARIVDLADNAGRPFAVVDKRTARLFVFGAGGRLLGASAVLLGLTRGDQPMPDAATRRPSSLAPAERTTPAGRYASEPGHNDKGEDIVWIDYDASLAIHRLRPSPAAERRAERLASPSPDDKRISFGCVVVPVAFYDEIVRPTLGASRGMVYVLPEMNPPGEAAPVRQFASNLR